jgi:hypothetical protein
MDQLNVEDCVCCICYSTKCSKKNQIVLCDGPGTFVISYKDCDIPVHQSILPLPKKTATVSQCSLQRTRNGFVNGIKRSINPSCSDDTPVDVTVHPKLIKGTLLLSIKTRCFQKNRPEKRLLTRRLRCLQSRPLSGSHG